MELNYYFSDVGSIKLINKSGAAFLIRNCFGDGSFKFYVFDTEKEMEEHVAGRYEVKDTNVWLNQSGWKVMTYDCAKTYEEDGVELDSDFIHIYQVDQCFMFVLNKKIK